MITLTFSQKHCLNWNGSIASTVIAINSVEKKISRSQILKEIVPKVNKLYLFTILIFII